MKTTTAAAVRHYGSKGRLAKALGISRQAISKWGRYPPPLRGYQLDALMTADISHTNNLCTKEQA